MAFKLFDPATFTGGGFSFSAGLYRVNLSQFAPYQAKDKEGKPLPDAKLNTVLHMNLTKLDENSKPEKDDNGKDIVIERNWPVGESKNFLASEDGETPSKSNTGPAVCLAPKSDKKGIWKESKFAKFHESLINAGYDHDRWMEYGAYGLNGAIIELEEVPYKTSLDDQPDTRQTSQRAGAEEAKATAQKRREATVILVTDINHKSLAKEKDIGPGKAQERTTRTAAAEGGKANGKAVNGAAKPAKAASKQVEGDPQELALEALSTYITEKREQGKDSVLGAALRTTIRKQLEADGVEDDTKDAVMSLLKDQDDLGKLLAELGCSLEGANITIPAE